MILLPAIDILDGKAVRLRQGEYGDKTEYDVDPLDAAKRWVDGGGRTLHIVDLDGAKSGRPANLAHVERIAAALDVPIQLGGGLRTLESVRNAIEAGVARAVLGTAAYTDVDFLDEALGQYGNRIVVSVDARGGKLASSGWTEQTEMEVEPAIDRLGGRGVRRFVFSSIERDGMLTGPDLDAATRVAEVVRGSFIYSGGIGTLDDLRALASLRQVNLTGVIVGKALYEGRFTVAEALEALKPVPRADD